MMAGANSLQLHRALPLNDSENTELFTFKLSLRNLEEFKGRHIKSSVIFYQGHEWYLTCKYSGGGKDAAAFIGVYVYWGSPAEGERCKADFRIIMRNIVDPTRSLVTEGSQVEFSAPKSPGWGKREFASLPEILCPGGGFLQEPEGIVIVELAMKSCSTILEQYVDFNQIMLQQRDQHFPSHFTSNFRLGGLEFYLSLYPLGDRPEADGYVSIYLHRFVGNESEYSALLGCRLRYRFFIGHLFCPSSSKTFEYTFKNEQGYGRFRGFEPIQEGRIFKMQGPTPIGVEVVACTPIIQPEIKLVTKGYYHLSNITFEDTLFSDHRGNRWKLSIDPDSPTLNLLMELMDEGDSDPPPQGKSNLPLSDSTKFVQWRAYVMSRSDRRKTLPVIGCPLTAYFSRGLPQKNFNMTTNIPLNKAKSLDGDYSSKEDPALLIRLEMLNIQDIPGVLYDYPTLDFERFQLYHTREGLKRCLKQNELLMEELASIRGQQHPTNGPIQTPDTSNRKVIEPSPRTPASRKTPARPSSLSASSMSSLAGQSNQPAVKGQPPKPPPRAYSPISDNSNMKRYAFSRMTPLPASTAAPSGTQPSPTNPNGGIQLRQLPPTSDSAFKRFSFTGINVTPSMLSGDQAADPSQLQVGPTPQGAGASFQLTSHLTNGGGQNGAQVAPVSSSLQNLTVTDQQAGGGAVIRRPKPNQPPHGQSRGSYHGPSQAPFQGPTSSESAFKRFSFTGVSVSPALTSDSSSGGLDPQVTAQGASGPVHEQHNPIYQSTDPPQVRVEQNSDMTSQSDQAPSTSSTDPPGTPAYQVLSSTSTDPHDSPPYHVLSSTNTEPHESPPYHVLSAGTDPHVTQDNQIPSTSTDPRGTMLMSAPAANSKPKEGKQQEDYVQKYTLLQQEDIEADRPYTLLDPENMDLKCPNSQPLASPRDSPQNDKERLLEFRPQQLLAPDVTQTGDNKYSWQPVGAKNTNSYMETEI